MEDAIKDCLIEENLSNVNVISYDNLSVDAAISCNCNYIIRGLRNDRDYHYEQNVAKINEELSNLDTIYIRSGKYGFISSTMIMDLINNIQSREPDLDISHIGEPNFIITYKKEGTVNIVIRWCKVIFVCLATFFGAGFSIMTFNNDLYIDSVF